jgi:hypothetical protein
MSDAISTGVCLFIPTFRRSYRSSDALPCTSRVFLKPRTVSSARATKNSHAHAASLLISMRENVQDAVKTFEGQRHFWTIYRLLSQYLLHSRPKKLLIASEQLRYYEDTITQANNLNRLLGYRDSRNISAKSVRSLWVSVGRVMGSAPNLSLMQFGQRLFHEIRTRVMQIAVIVFSAFNWCRNYIRSTFQFIRSFQLWTGNPPPELRFKATGARVRSGTSHGLEDYNDSFRESRGRRCRQATALPQTTSGSRAESSAPNGYSRCRYDTRGGATCMPRADRGTPRIGPRSGKRRPIPKKSFPTSVSYAGVRKVANQFSVGPV